MRGSTLEQLTRGRSPTDRHAVSFFALAAHVAVEAVTATAG